LDADTPLYKAARTAAALPHSRYPVIDGTADDVIGFVHVRDLLAPDRVDRGLRVETIVREVYRLPDSLKLIPALNQMREQRAHLAIVMDEYGGTAGIVTMEDLVEELVGEIEDEYDQPSAESVNGTEVDGLLNVAEFTERTGIDIPDGPYETVGGFIMASLGRIPSVGDRVDLAGGHLDVIALEGRRVARLAVTVPTSEPTNVVPTQSAADKE
jgi:putative hemolysin